MIKNPEKEKIFRLSSEVERNAPKKCPIFGCPYCVRKKRCYSVQYHGLCLYVCELCASLCVEIFNTKLFTKVTKLIPVKWRSTVYFVSFFHGDRVQIEIIMALTHQTLARKKADALRGC